MANFPRNPVATNSSGVKWFDREREREREKETESNAFIGGGEIESTVIERRPFHEQLDCPP